MSNINKAIIIGRLGGDPQIRQFDNGSQVANLSIATSERWTDKQTGEQKEQTEWHKVTLYNRLAEIAGQYLKKGALVYIEGSLHTRKWTDQQGIERYTTEIKAQSMQMLGGGQNSTQNQAPQAQNAYLQSYGQIPQGQGGQWGNPPPQGQQRPIGMTSSLYQPMQSAPQPITPPTPPMGQGGRVPDEDVPF